MGFAQGVLGSRFAISTPEDLPPPPDAGCLLLPLPSLQFATDPRNDTVYRKYLYVLATREQLPSQALGRSEGSGPAPSSRLCDCVEVYLQSSGQRVFKMTFHFSMKFRQIVLVGQETERSLLLLTGEGARRAGKPSVGGPSQRSATGGGECRWGGQSLLLLQGLRGFPHERRVRVLQHRPVWA